MFFCKLNFFNLITNRGFYGYFFTTVFESSNGFDEVDFRRQWTVKNQFLDA